MQLIQIAPGGPRQAATAVRSPVAALAMVAIVALASLVLEGGNAYAQQRQTQNAADAAVERRRDGPGASVRQRGPG